MFYVVVYFDYYYVQVLYFDVYQVYVVSIEGYYWCFQGSVDQDEYVFFVVVCQVLQDIFEVLVIGFYFVIGEFCYYVEKYWFQFVLCIVDYWLVVVFSQGQLLVLVCQFFIFYDCMVGVLILI